MSRTKLVSIAFIAGAALVAAGLGAQEGGAPPGPGPEHKFLERYAGTWECDVEASMVPGAPPEKSRGTSKSRVACGGLWLVTDFESTMMGGPFSGHEIVGYDPATKKYSYVWVDSMSTSAVLGEGSFDEKTKTVTTTMRGRDPAGGEATWRQVEVWKDADTRDWVMYSKLPDGTEQAVIKITYRRKKSP